MRIRSSFTAILPEFISLFSWPAALTIAATALLGSGAAQANVLSWSGNGATANWSDSGNWGFVAAPASGDTLVFSAFQPRPVNTNDIAGLALAQIRFAGAGGGYVISGNGFTLASGISATNTAGANSINNGITFGGSDVTVEVGNGVSLTLAGTLQGTAGVIKIGLGTLLYQTAGSNPYAGTTRVNAGLLQLNVGGINAFGGPLVIGDGSGAGSPTVRLLQGTEMPDTQPITVNLNGLLDLNSFSDATGPLTIQGATVSTGSGLLMLNGGLTVLGSAVEPTISGNLRFNGGMREVNIADGATFRDLNLLANVSDGGGGLLFTNSAPSATFARLAGNNSFTGPLIVDNITLSVETPTALGTTNSGTMVGSHGTLWLYSTSITNESLTMASGARLYGQDNCIWTGPTVLNGDVAVGCYPAVATLTLLGAVGGSGGFEKVDVGTLQLFGSVGNTYAGNTFIQAGTCVLDKAVGVAIPGGTLTIGDHLGSAAVVRDINVGANLGSTVAVVINEQGLLDLNGEFEIVGPITLSGGTISTGTGRLQINGDVTTLGSTNNAVINGSVLFAGGLRTITVNRGYAPGGWDVIIPATIGDSGSGIQFFSGASSLIHGPTVVLLEGSNYFTGPLTVSGGTFVSADTPWSLGTTNGGTFVTNGATLFVGGTGITNETVTLATGTTLAGEWGGLAGNPAWAGPIVLAGDATIYGFNYLGLFEILGAISGPGNLTVASDGELIRFSGPLANTYTGLTTVAASQYPAVGTTLLLNRTGLGNAIPGALIINSNCTVRNLQDYQISSPLKPVTILDTGLLDLTNHNEWIGSLTLKGAQITTGSGLLYLGGDILVNTSSVAMSKISGNATLWNGTKTITCANHNFSPDFQILANLGGNAASGIIKNGDGELNLVGANTFPGPVTVNAGSLEAESSSALGNTNTPATINPGGTLFLIGSVNIGLKPLSLSGTGGYFGAFSAGFGNSSWAGNITLAGDTGVDVYGGASLTLSGAIGGPGALVKTDLGTLTLSGPTPNTYLGATTVSAGTLVLGKANSTAAVPGSLDISGTVHLAANDQTPGTSDVSIQSSGRLETAGYIDYINALSGNGQVDLGSAGWLLIGDNSGSCIFNGVISGSGDLYKYGTGTITFTGTNTYTGTTHVANGTLLVNGYQPQSPVDFYSGTIGTLGGIGVVGPIYATGTIKPGVSSGCLTSSNLTFAASGTCQVELNGTTPCSGYDQMIVHGTNNLANATLNVTAAFTIPPVIGQQFVIINNDGFEPITGTFAGLPNNATFNVGGIGLRINYNGGDGNDVVLTVVNAPGASLTLNATAQGWYDNTGFYGPPNPNYLAGELGTNSLRNWFVFNVPVFTGSVAKAELLINCYTNISPYGQETYVLRQVSTPIGTLMAGGSGLTNIYNDLGDGPVYADRKINVIEAGERAIIPLNVTFINDAVAAMGGQIALGGSIATLDGAPHNQSLFAYSGFEANDVQLRLTFGTTTFINATADGWYDNTGIHFGNSSNYFAGAVSGRVYRDFFVFGLPAMSARPIEAELLLKPVNVFGPTNWVNYQLHDVTTPISTLTNAASGATGIFADLGDGYLYGGREIYTNEGYQSVNSSIPLNGQFTAAAFANSGGQMALGGAMTLDPAPVDQGAFDFSVSNPGDAQLWLSFIPTSAPPAFFLPGSPTVLGSNVFKFVLSGTTGTTNEIQASMDFANWDIVQTLYMTNTTATFLNTNAVFPYRYLRARLLQ